MTARKLWQTAAVAFPLAVLLCLALGKFPICHPVRYRPADYRALSAFAQAQRGRKAAVLLPPRLRHLSATGRMYFTEGTVFVPTWVGRTMLIPDLYGPGDDWIEGIVLLPPSVTIEKDDPIEPLNVPAFSTPWSARQNVEVQIIDMAVGPPVSGRWHSADSSS